MERYDSALLGILQSEGKVAPFLDTILGFLYRRTDYFRIMKTDHDKLGFPPGVAKKLLMNIFSKYESQAQKDAAKVEEMRKENASKQVEASTDASSTNKNDVPSSTPLNNPIEAIASETQHTDFEDERGVEESVDPGDRSVSKMETDSQPEPNKVENESAEEKSQGGGSEEKEDPEVVLQRRMLQANPLTYNGAERDNYFWSQTITETDVRVKIPTSILKGKQMRVNISKKHISVSHQTESGSWNMLVDDDLEWEIDAEESMWTLTPGEFVHINLEKKEERWWECVFVGEPKINTRKIDCSRPMTDLDDEAQAKIEEMMYNQRQKQLGLPQSHEQKTHDMLRKAWDAEGSPFKGQPFDPSKFNVDANGVVNMKPAS